MPILMPDSNVVFRRNTIINNRMTLGNGEHLTATKHQYVERNTGLVRSERAFGDQIVSYLYCKKREQPPLIYQLLGSQWFSTLLGWVNYDFPFGADASGINRFLKDCAVDLSEYLERPEELDSARRVFERRIRYWQCRPMTDVAQRWSRRRR